MMIKISRKEAKESRYWLSLVDVGASKELEQERKKSVKEVSELMMIFGAIVRKSE